MTVSIEADWLEGESLQKLLAALGAEGERARIAGGAVRNALLGEPVTDIDIATTCPPETVIRRAEAIGLKSVPTGIEHGTVTVIADGKGFEVTTLREDVETDGRRARVRFGRDWLADAHRRDFTINGLYAEPDGTVVDLIGGVEDLKERRLRFIGDAEARIREDYLRILRFFRFFAWYGRGRPDPEGLKACARLKAGLDGLSAERVWNELKRLLSAPDPARSLLWMRQAGVLSRVLPETEKWGIDGIHSLIAVEKSLDWEPDPILRLEMMIPPRKELVSDLAVRLKLSKAEARRLADWVGAEPVPPDLEQAKFDRLLYRKGLSGVEDRLRLSIAGDKSGSKAVSGHERLLNRLLQWRKPKFPVSGKDLAGLGIEPGEEMGKLLASLEAQWVEENFKPDKAQLIARVDKRPGSAADD